MTDAAIAGVFLGMLMASVFVSLGAIILFPYVDPKSNRIKLIAERGANTTQFVMAVLAFYPGWAVVGALTGLLFLAFERAVPSDGLGSPNLAFTLALLGFSVLITVPAAYLLARSKVAVVLMGLAFAGLFGWALPHFAV